MHALSDALVQGKTHGVDIFLLIKMNIKFDIVFLLCNVIVYKARAYSYVEAYYVSFQKIGTES